MIRFPKLDADWQHFIFALCVLVAIFVIAVLMQHLSNLPTPGYTGKVIEERFLSYNRNPDTGLMLVEYAGKPGDKRTRVVLYSTRGKIAAITTETDGAHYGWLAELGTWYYIHNDTTVQRWNSEIVRAWRTGDTHLNVY